ncbi:hypothetical protein Tco_0167219 [Tanacetum coccineum]
MEPTCRRTYVLHDEQPITKALGTDNYYDTAYHSRNLTVPERENHSNFSEDMLRACVNSIWQRLCLQPLPLAEFFMQQQFSTATVIKKKDFKDTHVPGKWEMARDAELNPFRDVLVFREMVESLGAIPVNFKGNMLKFEDMVDKKMD